jgi:hypothetical protein
MKTKLVLFNAALFVSAALTIASFSFLEPEGLPRVEDSKGEFS